MKTLFLIIQRMKQYVLKNKLIFALFVISSILCSVVVTYFYGNTMLSMQNRSADDPSYRKYFVTFLGYGYVDNTDENYDPTLAPELTPIMYDGELDGNELFESVIVGHDLGESSVIQHGDKVVLSCTYGEAPLMPLRGTLEFTDKYQVIIPDCVSYDVGETIELAGHEFTVIGQNSYYNAINDEEAYYIPYETFKELGFETTRIWAYTKERYAGTGVEIGEKDGPIYELLSETFPTGSADARGYHRVSLDESAEAAMRRDIYPVFASYALSVVAFMFLLQYLLDSVMDETIISVIVGAKKSKLTFMIFCETFFLCAVTSALGIAIHKLFYGSFFTAINISPELTYTAGDYLTIYLSMLAISIIVVIPFLYKYMTLSPIEARREHM